MCEGSAKQDCIRHKEVSKAVKGGNKGKISGGHQGKNSKREHGNRNNKGSNRVWRT